MKFSYTLFKKLVPAVKDKKEIIEKLNLHFFEAEDLRGDILDISIPANRFSDAASHFGIAREIAAILNVKAQKNVDYIPADAKMFPVSRHSAGACPLFKVEVQDKNLCPRYTAQYFENIKIASSPKWMQKVLIDCGLRPINNVVDIMNYAMLETGQPLHAFDYDKLIAYDLKIKTIVVRRAKKGERITTLENKIYPLDEDILVIADTKMPLAIAGIKGGKLAEVDRNTKRIIVESANFNGVNIYKTSKSLNLSTDASLRFSHNISPQLTIIGIGRAAQLLREIVGAQSGQVIDANFVKYSKKIIKFDADRFNKFIGADLNSEICQKYLKRLGFKIIKTSRFGAKSHFFVEVPPLRGDVKLFEDLAEEAIRLYGYNRLKSLPPRVHLRPPALEDQIIFKSKINKALMGFGLSEVCNYSFIGEDDLRINPAWKTEIVELKNPVSAQLKYLRPSLVPGLLRNIKSNSRFFGEAKIFEIGKVFYRREERRISPNTHNISEKLTLGIALFSKNRKGEIFFELKGIIEQLFRKIGLVDYLMPEAETSGGVNNFADYFLIRGEILEIKSGGKTIGYLGRVNWELLENQEAALAEIDLNALLRLVEEEHEYLPLPKYPSAMRDISILIEPTVRVGEIMQAIQESNLKYIEDVDLIDEFDISDKRQATSGKTRSLTFRIVFQAKDRTLTDKEINREKENIIRVLKNKFRAIIR